MTIWRGAKNGKQTGAWQMDKADIAFSATQPDASAWVSANAGSGKTYVLVSRLVRLMLDGVAPEKLLCLTYTRSAAAEMQERLFDLLAEWALLADEDLRAAIAGRLGPDAQLEDLTRARTLFARALETPGGLRVQTIHAFCESLLKRFPLEARLSPQFELLDEQDAQDMQQKIIASALNGAGDDASLAEAMARLTRTLSAPELASLGRLIIDQREALDKTKKADNLATLAAHLELPEDVPSSDLLLAAWAEEFAPMVADFIAWLAQGGVQDQKKADGLRAGQLAIKAQDWHGAWAALRPVFFTDAGALRAKLATKDRLAKAPKLAAAMQMMADAAVHLRDKLNAISTYEMTQSLFQFADYLLAAYADEKRRRAVLDYDDLIGVTNELLEGEGAAQWVLFKIDTGLTHILVDEAQDTSPAQWRVIRALANEFFVGDTAHDGTSVRTIFAVGDEKQSIFSFQGADPAAFDEQYRDFKETIGAIGGQLNYVPLTISRRSVPQVLALVDLVFGDATRREGVSTRDDVAHTAFRASETGHVELWPADTADIPDDDVPVSDVPSEAQRRAAQDDGRTKLAARMADKIASLLADKTQNVTAGDMLILVRKRDGFVDEMTRALKRRRIAVAGADRMVLLEQIAIMDILAALDVALHRADDLSLAIVLRSPLGGVSEADLFDLAHGREASLWDAFEMAAKSKQADASLQAAYARLEWLRRHIERLPPYELLARFLGAQGGHRLLSARLGSEIDDPIGELLRLALAYETRHVASMQGFVHWLRQGHQEIKRDMEGRGAAVRIMTVHGAKGLEAPIVFLPDTCRAPVKRGGQVNRLQFDAARRPLWRASKALQESYGEAQVARAERQARQEEKRLLYVALTRARDRLYIGGWLGKRDTQPAEGSWYDMIAQALGDDLQQLALGETALPAMQSAQTVTVEASVPPPDWVHKAAPKETKTYRYFADKLFSPSALAQGDAPVTSPAGAQGEGLRIAAQRGRLIHTLLETLPDLPPAERQAAALAYLKRVVLATGQSLDAAAQAQIIGEAMGLMAQPELADLFGAHARAEAPIAGVLEMADGQHLAMSGQIDRLVELDDAIWLVDFKTGARQDDNSAYRLQMAAYRALMQKTNAEKPIRCALIWTQTPHIEWLDTADLDSAMADILSGRVQLT